MIFHSVYRLCFFLGVLILITANIRAQGTAGSAALYESLTVVDMPTAGVVPLKNYLLTSRLAPLGNFTARMAVVPFKNFNISLFTTAQHLISNSPIEVELPTLQAQLRLVDETRSFPALAVGISSKTNEYFTQDFLLNQSVGAWITASKNFRGVLGTIALHGGILASKPSISGFAGFEQSIGNSIAIVAEATLISKNDAKGQRELNGIANAGLRWSVVRGVTLELIVHDLFSSVSTAGISRAFGIEFIRAW